MYPMPVSRCIPVYPDDCIIIGDRLAAQHPLLHALHSLPVSECPSNCPELSGGAGTITRCLGPVSQHGCGLSRKCGQVL